MSGAPVVIIGMTYEVHSFRFVRSSREGRDVVEFPLEDLPLQFSSSIIPLLVIGREIPRYLVDLSRCTSSENGVGGCWHVVIYSRRVHQCVCPGREAGAAEGVPDADLTGNTIAYRVVPSSDIAYHVDRGRKELFFIILGGRPMFLKHHFRWSCLGCANPSGWVVLFKRVDPTRIWRP